MSATIRRATRHRVRLALVVAAVSCSALASFMVTTAFAFGVQNLCQINASGGFQVCNTLGHPTYERVQAKHSAGLPYKMLLHNTATGQVWGPWQWNDLNIHYVTVTMGDGWGDMLIDNLGSANPAAYDSLLQW